MNKQLLSLLFCVCLHFNLPANFHVKQQQWDEFAEDVNSWGQEEDGFPVDDGIKETVIVLNLMGFTTASSCEGHLDHGRPYPWILFQVRNKDLIKLEDELFHLQKKVDKKVADLQKKFPKLIIDEIIKLLPKKLLKTMDKSYKLGLIFDELAKKEFESFNELLDLYYQSHHEVSGTKLTLTVDRIILLCSQEAELQWTRTKGEKRMYLEQYQKEMRDFTQFLKKLYFQSE